MANKNVALEKFLRRFRVTDGRDFKLKKCQTDWAGDESRPEEQRKELALKFLQQNVEGLAKMQNLLYAADSHSVLLIFQAMDAAGKDGTIRHVMSGVNPQGCQVYSFKHPSAEELDHDFLWRYYRALPERGRIGIFNRSYYEEVLVVRVHDELVKSQRIPGARADSKNFWRDRYESINAMERHLARNGTLILKFFLNISKDEQKRRFLERLDNPEKNWKFSASDMKERAYWDKYMSAFEHMIQETSHAHAPWHVIPADHKWVARALVSSYIEQAIRGLGLRFPRVSKEQLAAFGSIREQLKKD